MSVSRRGGREPRRITLNQLRRTAQRAAVFQPFDRLLR